MPTNDFIGFASAGSANIMSQADYAAAIEQGDGVQPGMASSALANKVWRQGANMAAALGRITAARGYDALDNGDLDALQSSVDDAISAGTFNRMFFSQTSGSYTAPRTGVYRVTLKGGGGGGGGANTASFFGGGGGGEGGTIRFYVTLTQGQSYPYVIGAGGAAGSNAATATAPSGSAGGITSFNNVYSVKGGGGGANQNNASIGGSGGTLNSAPSGTTVEVIPGANGADGINGRTGWYQAGATGGGKAGSTQGGVYSAYGGGGDGGGGYFANPGYEPQQGADGYILIEYAG